MATWKRHKRNAVTKKDGQRKNKKKKRSEVIGAG